MNLYLRAERNIHLTYNSAIVYLSNIGDNLIACTNILKLQCAYTNHIVQPELLTNHLVRISLGLFCFYFLSRTPDTAQPLAPCNYQGSTTFDRETAPSLFHSPQLQLLSVFIPWVKVYPPIS